MFRIKTDIRQYKCDTQDKVEKLIRNWVIRPNDLIFSADDNAWHPIGEHPSFVKLFGILDEQIRNEPDTVVTQEVAGRPAGSVKGKATAHGKDAQTQDALVEEATRVEPSPYHAAEDAPIPAPPEPPEGVEPSLRTSDEITMMTERTADLLGEDAVPQEHTEIFDRDELGLESGVEPSSSVDIDIEESEARPIGRHDLPEDFFATAEISSPIDRNSLEPPLDELGDLSEAEADEATLVTESPLDQTSELHAVVESDEELRATNELTIDELQSIASARGVHTEEDDTGLVIAETVPSAEDLLDDEELPASDDANGNESAGASEEEGAEDIETENDHQSSTEEEDEEPTQALTVADDEEAGADVEDVETDEEDEDEDEDEEAPLDESGFDEDDFEDDDFEDDEVDAAPLPPGPTQNLDFVSEGYDIELPFEVKPTEEDLAMGLKRSRVSRSVKDRHFPIPTPKKPKQILVRRFDFTKEPPRDQSLALVAIIVVALVVVVGIVAFIVT